MYCVSACKATAALFVFLALASSGAWAAAKEVKPSAEFKGSVDDQGLQKGTPECLTDADALRKLCASWKVADKLPEVDFAKNIVVTSTTVGSLLRLRVTLDDQGDLKVGGMASRDLRPGFRYVIAVVSREGVKTVNGKFLPGK